MIIIIYNKKVGSTSKASASGLLVTANLKHGVNSIRAQSFTRSQRWSRGQNLLIKTQKLVRNPKLKNTLLTALYQNASHLWKMRSQQIAEMKLKKTATTGEGRRNVITTISRSSVKCDGRRKKNCDGHRRKSKVSKLLLDFLSGKMFRGNFQRSSRDQFSFEQLLQNYLSIYGSNFMVNYYGFHGRYFQTISIKHL